MEFSEKTKNILNNINRIEPNSIISIEIILNGKRFSYSVGNKDFTLNTYFQIGSNTKLYTAALILKYVKENKISLDDTIDKYLKLNSKYTYPTIENLLTHFGYRPLISRKFVLNYLFKKTNLYKNLYGGIDSSSLERYLYNKKLPKKLFYFYSDINYAILGLIIEKISLKSYEETMQMFLEEDLHLKETAINPQNGVLIPSYYRKKNSKWMNWKINDIYMAAGGINTTSNDAYEFSKLFLEGEISYLDEMLKKRKTILFGKLKMGVGYGWHCYINGKYFFHKGGVACFRANYYIDKSKKIAVSILSNVIGNKSYNTTTLGMSIHKDIKEYLRKWSNN